MILHLLMHKIILMKFQLQITQNIFLNSDNFEREDIDFEDEE